MKKTGIILTTFALTMLWGQKEILSVSTDQVISLSDRDNNSAVVDIDPAMIQEIRTVKKSMDKLHIKRQMMKAVPSGPRSFKVSKSESRFADVQKIIEQIKDFAKDPGWIIEGAADIETAISLSETYDFNT